MAVILQVELYLSHVLRFRCQLYLFFPIYKCCYRGTATLQIRRKETIVWHTHRYYTHYSSLPAISQKQKAKIFLLKRCRSRDETASAGATCSKARERSLPGPRFQARSSGATAS